MFFDLKRGSQGTEIEPTQGQTPQRGQLFLVTSLLFSSIHCGNVFTLTQQEVSLVWPTYGRGGLYVAYDVKGV